MRAAADDIVVLSSFARSMGTAWYTIAPREPFGTAGLAVCADRRDGGSRPSPEPIPPEAAEE
jgi:hypothetical protein